MNYISIKLFKKTRKIKIKGEINDTENRKRELINKNSGSLKKLAK